MDHKQYKAMLAKDQAYQELRRQNKHKLPLVISAMLTKARKTKKLTQQELADELDTKQSSIARAENGSSLPSLLFLKRIADVYETDLIPPRFSFLEQSENPAKWLVVDEGKTNYVAIGATNSIREINLSPMIMEAHPISLEVSKTSANISSELVPVL